MRTVLLLAIHATAIGHIVESLITLVEVVVANALESSDGQALHRLPIVVKECHVVPHYVAKCHSYHLMLFA